MRIAGFRSFSLVDYPGKISAVVFTGGCNLRCPWCHNWQIAYGKVDYDESETVKNALATRLKKRLNAVCITGGEPTIQRDLKDFVIFLKKTGYLVKIDTNGTHPEIVKDMAGIVDYFAIDIKARPEKYPLLTGMNFNVWDRVRKSVKIMRERKMEYELRMTYVPGLNDEEDLTFFSNFVRKGEKAFVTVARSTSKFEVPDNYFFKLKVRNLKFR